MLDKECGIEVLVRPFGQQQAFEEWGTTQEVTPGQDRRNKAYIQASANTQYEVVTIIHPKFRWRHARCLRLVYRIDGTAIEKTKILVRPNVERGISAPLQHVFRTCTLVRGGKLELCGLKFGSSELVEDPTFLSVEEERLQLGARGKISIFVQRGKLSSRSTVSTDGPIGDVVTAVAQTNKRVMMNRGRSHFTVPHALTSVPLLHEPEGQQMEVRKSKWIPARGDAGCMIRFTIQYTNQMYLQKMGILPTNIETTVIDFTDDADSVAGLLTTKATSGGDQEPLSIQASSSAVTQVFAEGIPDSASQEPSHKRSQLRITDLLNRDPVQDTAGKIS